MSFSALIQLVWLVQYGQALEGGVFVASTADFAYLVLFVAAVLACVSLLIPALGLYVTGPSLVFALLYIWCRHHPRSQSSIMGLVTLPALYLPWAFLAMAVCGVGGSPVADGGGLAVGHLYFFLTAIHPAAGGRRLLATPVWLSRALLRAGVGRVPVAAAGVANPAAPGFRACGGAGRRLADCGRGWG
jgi:Derlin-2/3